MRHRDLIDRLEIPLKVLALLPVLIAAATLWVLFLRLSVEALVLVLTK